MRSIRSSISAIFPLSPRRAQDSQVINCCRGANDQPQRTHRKLQTPQRSTQTQPTWALPEAIKLLCLCILWEAAQHATCDRLLDELGISSSNCYPTTVQRVCFRDLTRCGKSCQPRQRTKNGNFFFLSAWSNTFIVRKCFFVNSGQGSVKLLKARVVIFRICQEPLYYWLNFITIRLRTKRTSESAVLVHSTQCNACGSSISISCYTPLDSGDSSRVVHKIHHQNELTQELLQQVLHWKSNMLQSVDVGEHLVLGGAARSCRISRNFPCERKTHCQTSGHQLQMQPTHAAGCGSIAVPLGVCGELKLQIVTASGERVPTVFPNTSVFSTVFASFGAVRRLVLVVDASSWCHNLLALRGPFKKWLVVGVNPKTSFGSRQNKSSVTVAPEDIVAAGRVAGLVARGHEHQDREFSTSCSDTVSGSPGGGSRDSQKQRVARVRGAMQNEHRANAQQRFARDVEEFFTLFAGSGRSNEGRRSSASNDGPCWTGDDQCAVMQWLMAKSC